MLTMADKGGMGVRQMLTLADKGWRGFWLIMISLKKLLKITPVEQRGSVGQKVSIAGFLDRVGHM